MKLSDWQEEAHAQTEWKILFDWFLIQHLFHLGHALVHVWAGETNFNLVMIFH